MYRPPTLLAPPPPSSGGNSLASFGSIVGGLLAPVAPFAIAASDVYGARQAAKTAERTEKRAFLLEQQRLASSTAGAGDVKPTFLSPPVFLAGGAALLLLVYLIARKR